jgi:hypothetical protein
MTNYKPRMKHDQVMMNHLNCTTVVQAIIILQEFENLHPGGEIEIYGSDLDIAINWSRPMNQQEILDDDKATAISNKARVEKLKRDAAVMGLTLIENS